LKTDDGLLKTWIEADKIGKEVLKYLRDDVDVAALVEGKGHQHPPQPSTPEEVAAIALCIIDNAQIHKKHLFEIAFALGIQGAGSKIQTTHDVFETRYLQPFYDFLKDKLFVVNISASQSNVMNFNQVFIVHGRDEELKETVARFISKLGLEPIILHEQANKGRAIIEKFEQCAEVGFAVILLTPDDVGSLKDGNLRPRARQNVIFEMGYFIGRLTRTRVAALYKGNDMDLPSDYAGVIYTQVDAIGAWKFLLIKELQAAGFNVDANRAL
jgi:hypothetical protein